jgi:hypothetical protein
MANPQNMILNISDNGKTINISLNNVPRVYKYMIEKLYEDLLNLETTEQIEDIELIEFIEEDEEEPIQITKPVILYSKFTAEFIKELKLNKTHFNWITKQFGDDLYVILTDNINETFQAIANKKNSDGTDSANATKKAVCWELHKIAKKFDLLTTQAIYDEAVKYNQIVSADQSNKELMPMQQANAIINQIQHIYDKCTNIDHKVILKFILDYGSLRPEEYIDMHICNGASDCDNYFNLETKELIIANHKNKKYNADGTINKDSIRVIPIKDDFIAMLKKKSKSFFIHNNRGQQYSRSDKLSEFLKTLLNGITPTEVRHAIVARTVNDFMNTKDNTRVLELCNIHGHQFATQLQYYIKK